MSAKPELETNTTDDEDREEKEEETYGIPPPSKNDLEGKYW